MNSSLEAFRKCQQFWDKKAVEVEQNPFDKQKICESDTMKNQDEMSTNQTTSKHSRGRFNDYMTQNVDQRIANFQSNSSKDILEPPSIPDLSCFDESHQIYHQQVKTPKENMNFLEDSFGATQRSRSPHLQDNIMNSPDFKISQTPTHSQRKKKLVRTPKKNSNSPHVIDVRAAPFEINGAPAWKKLNDNRELLVDNKDKAELYHSYACFHPDKTEGAFKSQINAETMFSPSSGNSDSWIQVKTKKSKKKGKKTRKRNKTNKKALNKSHNSNYHEFCLKWQKERNKDLKKKRKQMAYKIMEECTFQPNMHGNKQKLTSKRGRYEKGLFEHFGVDSHIERLQKAKYDQEMVNKMKEKGLTLNCKSRNRLLRGKNPSIKIPKRTIPKKQKFNKRFVLNDLDASTNNQFNITSCNELLHDVNDEREIYNFARNLSFSDLSERYPTPNDSILPEESTEFKEAVMNLHNFLHTDE
ncbi:unnamed protein product [Moneuplotes crassus]|uniref:Uncharacterized protein n=1 Tax=Euplotes crassus TaxID=5936 RepID=A0AAD1XDX3_EUPCR|nr:unnamed protein product [Moneuplotes crassus]